MDASLRVLGLGELINNLKQLETRLSTNIVRIASRASANVFLKPVKAQAYGPGRERRTGLLQRSLAVTVSKKGDKVVGHVKVRPVNIAGKSKVAKAVRGARRIAVGTGPRTYAAFYWRFLEKGVAHERTTESGAARGRLSARKWVEPVFDAFGNQAIDAYRETVTRRLDDAAKSLPKTGGHR